MSLRGVQYVRGAMRSTVAPTTFAKPKAVAMDYRSAGSEFGGTAFDATALALHLKYPISVLNMTATQAAPAGAGYAFVQSLMAADAAHIVGQYIIATQQYDSVSGGSTFNGIWSKLDAGGTSGGSWWAKNVATGLKTRTGQVQSFPAYEVNLCPAYTTANSDGDKAAQVIAKGYLSIHLNNLYAAGARLVFCDNWWMCPGSFTTVNTLDTAGNDLGSLKVGDYNLDGSNDTRTNTDWASRDNVPNPEFRKGEAAFANTLKANLSGLKIAANADGDFLTDATFGNSGLGTTEYMTGSDSGGKVVDYGYIEGLTAFAGSTSNRNMASCIDAYRGNFANVINRYYTQHDGCAVGAIVGAYVKSLTETQSRTLQKCRYALGVAMLGDGYCAVSDRGLGASNMKPYWFDELDQLIGDASETRPTAAATGYDGMWKRAYSNGLIVVNPSANKGRWMQNAGGTLTLNRVGGTTTFTWNSTGVGSAVTLTPGVSKIRFVDTDSGGLDGTFTVATATVSANSIVCTFADPRADSSNTKPYGFVEFQATVDLTGQGYRRFLGTQDGHDDYDGGTSQNDGTTVTTLKLWSGDAVLLLKA